MYTHRGDTIVDLDGDPHLEHASSTTSRTYLPITDPTAVADLDAPTDPISLVVLRWPPRHNVSGGGPYGIILPDASADAHFVGEARMPLVAYLNWTFRHGGFPRRSTVASHPQLREGLHRL